MGKLIVLLLAAVVFIGALGEYICGRVILPAMGLTAPSYWAWFWFMTWGLVFSGILFIIKELIDD